MVQVIENRRFIVWNDSFSIGNDIIDRQHRTFAEVINELFLSIQNNKDNKSLHNKILSSLENYINSHVADEEEIIQKLNYPHFESHKRNHQELILKVQELRSRYRMGKLHSSDLLLSLKKWWKKHVCVEDQDLAKYIQKPIAEATDQISRFLYYDKRLFQTNYSKGQLNLFSKIATLFGKHKETITEKWLEHCRDDFHDFPILRESIETLLEDFVDCLSSKNVTKYLERNRIMSRRLAVQDIPYCVLMDAYHGFEDAYAVLFNNSKINYMKYFALLDSLHHKTISILANEYFRIRDLTALALAELTDLRDPETGGHVKRTSMYAAIIAQELGYSHHYVEQLHRMSPLHDLGKVGIPDNILLKKGPLNSFEFEIMKKHTVIGPSKIKSITSGFSSTMGCYSLGIEVSGGHHEKWDGTGYPKGLKGKEIPEPARIFSIVDTYDALRSKRPYKGPISHEQACLMILKGSDDGRTRPEHFDPVVLNSFKKNVGKLLEVSKQYTD